ncbi:MAG: FAD-dependent oxidoreductase [Eggerthellaceae bacterium]|nr:FAD-dependent oxidoreductase [Eggerthellaceae bacterium]
MSNLSIREQARDDAEISRQAKRFIRRVEATPPGICPIAFQLSMLESAATQTCGKCVPCRDGLPQLVHLVRRVARCTATEETLEQIRRLATMIRDMSDCAIGYEAAEDLLDSMRMFADEYSSHIEKHRCREGVGQTIPCETDCPAHVNIPGYIALINERDYEGAVMMVRKDNPFPTACGFICEHPCERRCRRTLIDSAINIRGLKGYACDKCHADMARVPDPLPDTGKSIAIVGAGPSGLTCAYFLALMGHDVDVFERHKHLGGMMRYGIPAYRFPRERLDEDINAILSLPNISVYTELEISTEEMIDLSKEYDAMYIAIGSQVGKTLELKGFDAKGVISAVELLGEIGDGNYPDFTDKKVVVVGGGNVAMDCARTAVRCNAYEVTLAYRRRLEDMTALPAEIEGAIAEGVEMLTLEAPVHVQVNALNEVTGLITQPQMVGPIKRGRPSPINARKPKRVIEADIVIIAVGQEAYTSPFERAGIEADRGRLMTDDELVSTTEEHVFIGGDCQTGPSTVIRAIAAGKVAARNIDHYLGYHHHLDCGVTTPDPGQNDRTPTGRVNIADRPARQRKCDFSRVELEMSDEEAAQESARCLRCDAYGCGTTEKGRVTYV